VIKALELPSQAQFLVRAGGKRLRLTPPIRVLEEASSQHLDTALIVSQGNTDKLLHQLEDSDESDEDLPRKVPQPSNTGMEVVKFNAKPIVISIWEEGMWKTAEKNVSYGQTEDSVRYYPLRGQRLN
jgi:hypothetical protein